MTKSFVTVATLLAALFANSGVLAAEAPRLACADVAAASSPASTVAGKIAFVNHAATPVRLYWVNTAGERSLYNTLAAGQATTIGSYEGHLWVASWADTDACVFAYRTLAVPSTVSFTGSWVQSQACSQEGASSAEAAPASTITFRNSTAEPIQIHWINYNGGRQLMATIAAGATKLLNSYAGHGFTATDVSGNCRGFFRAVDGLWADVR